MTDLSGHTRVLGLVGHRARYSLSPRMHNALLRQEGIDAVYVLFDAHPDRAQSVADSIRALDISGVNLTVPFKERIVPYLDEMTQAAREAGAVNTVIHVDGELTGYNTDGEGLCLSLAEEHGVSPKDESTVVLGAGGAARAVAASMAAHGAERVCFLNRGRQRAEQACQHLQAFYPETNFEWASLETTSMQQATEGAGLVVNCLASGAEGLVRTFPVEGLRADCVWADINYWMEEQPLLQECRDRGLRVSDGLGMLAHQGALSFELFTGQPVSATEMRAALERVACVREPSG